ncbi:mucin-2-like isoform X2 [Gouania willdenowi]|uniref:mucin-2-like isoform X2 n=1 Tax=Gouania willdenowi TaxID=441366 RepID=UPI001054EA4D|nr:mucin-2-like isoform X2 [Gouania willdenowi]
MKWEVVWLSLFSLSLTQVFDIQAQKSENHVGRICSTWGREHFKTFDGDFFQFPGACEYNLVSDCKTDFKEFSVHIKRTNDSGNPTISYVVVTINNLAFRLRKSQITVNDEPVTTPYLKAGVQVESNADYIKLQSKVGITVMWNGEDAVTVEIDNDYASRTCGLCGNFDGVPGNDFTLKGRQMNPVEFGNKQKVRLPNDQCEDLFEGDDESQPEKSIQSCKNIKTVCDKLREASWSSCLSVVKAEPYYTACTQDVCGCEDNPNDFCFCSTLSEFSRVCSHAGGDPPSWRSADFCDKKCPYNMVYNESGSPCLDTCSNEDTSSLCEEHKMDGCFCPTGTVFDDISKRGCIPQSECQCKHNKIYESGEVYRQDREECTCREGSWECKSLQTPETCAIEDGSHVTTFDGKTFAFHGNCYYTLAKVESTGQGSPNFSIRAQLMPCTSQELDTCVKTVKVILNNNNNDVIMFNSDGSVIRVSEITLPYRSGDISIFQASSFHIMLQTKFGLQIQIQHVPIMQVYIKLDQSYTGKTRGLCGNYNRIMSDDIKTRQGIVEGTPTTFIDSWKTNALCSEAKERLDDPCTFSVENEQYAKYWCALLRSKNSTFTPCHSLVDPESYYKRCTFSSCNCEKSEACLCGVFSSYAQACASKGVVLPDWKENVCDKYMKNCPASQIFSLNQKRCQFTCKSLSSKDNSCLSDFSPVDGCNCAEGSYLDDSDTCVPVSKCPCNYNDVYIKAGKSITIKDERCVCSNGVLRCQSLNPQPTTCVAPKVFFNCSSAAADELEQQCTRTCSNPDKDDCDSTECDSGCRCPEGLLEDGQGSCVKENECPCKHNGQFYTTGAQIPKDCNKCTCNSGNWNCTEKQCPATCIIYGSGHYTTFDQQTYTFQGNCAYTAVKNKCGNKTQAENFGVVTENVPCGSTGTTCSKSVRVRLGRNEIKLFKGKYQEQDLGSGAEIEYKIRRVGLYLLIESTIGLAVVWDRRTTVRILLEPKHMGEVCGLCGNYDDDVQNDFTTQRLLVVSSPLDFGNSWKKSSTCPDAENVDDPCEASPNRHQWSKHMCSIITGNTFKECQKAVDPRPFYENCLKDSCACDGGGDCECFCAAVATYAQACSEAGVCVSWRTPEICPIFCDYFNHPDGCEWHYSPCHTPCLKTCANPTGLCLNPLPQLEGCFPVCPEDKPFLDERNHTCVKFCAPVLPTTTEVLSTEAITTTLPLATKARKLPTTSTVSTKLPPGVALLNETTPYLVLQTTPVSTLTPTGSTPEIVTPMTTSPLVPTKSNATTITTTSTTLPPGVTPRNRTTPSVTTLPITQITPITPNITTTPTVFTTIQVPLSTPNVTKPPTKSSTLQVPTTTPNITKPTTTTPPVKVRKPTSEDCPKFNAMINETFHFCNCTMAKCKGNDTLQIIPYECPPVAEITCSNGKKTLLEWDEFHCCQHSVCECVCEGWGDSHYNTFDGAYYTYKGNCTYVLMKEITPKFNLEVFIDGGSCDPNEASCPRSIIVLYGSLVIRLSGAPKLEALAKETTLELPFSQGGIKIISSGINLILEIPRIQVVIKYSKSGFSIFVPVKTFGRNTQGHCGTCNNIQSDDCMLPGGQLVKSCAVMADNWRVPNGKGDKKECENPRIPPTNILEPTTIPVSQGPTGPKTSQQGSQTTPLIGSASTTITRSTLPPPGTKTTFEAPTTFTGSKSPPTGTKGATETTMSSVTTTGLPGITETQTTIPAGFTTQGPNVGPGSTTQRTSSQVSESTILIGSGSTIITRTTLPPPGTKTTFEAPTTFTGSKSPPTGTKGATETTMSSVTTTGLPGITETQTTIPAGFTTQGPNVGPGSTTQRTSSQVSESTILIGFGSTIITRTTSPPPGTETTIVIPSTATKSTVTPTESEATAGTESTSFSTKPALLPSITETTTEKYTGPATTSATGVEKQKTSSTTLSPGATTTSTSRPGLSTEKPPPEVTVTTPSKGPTPNLNTISTIIGERAKTTQPGFTVTTQIPSGVSVTTPTESTTAGGKPTATTSQILPPGVSPTTKLTPSGKIVITGSTTEQVVPKVSKTTPSGFKATTIRKTTLQPPGTETTPIVFPSPTEVSEESTEAPFTELTPKVTGEIQTTPSIVTVTTRSTTEPTAPQGSQGTLKTGFTATTITTVSFPLGTQTTSVKPPSPTSPARESTQSVQTTPAAPTTPPNELSTTEPIPCRKDSVCGLLKNTDSPFAECHDYVNPSNFHSSCVSDSCNKADPAVECESLETYAAACALAGVCVDWRNYTKLCDSDCPPDKVYKACGPAEQPSCEDHPDEPPMNVTTEGCFCPEGMKLFNKDSEICVKTCGCLDPENKPREFNETFEYNCQDCTCHKSKTVTCKPKECPEPKNITCDNPGYVLVNETNPLDPCCFDQVCQCQISRCTVPYLNCSVGFKPVLTVPKEICCPKYQCVPKKVCVHEDVEYENGSSVPVNECEECVCIEETDSFSGGLLQINCTVPSCNKTCEEGFEYVKKESDSCCGKCEPTHCVVTENGTKQFLIEGESWSPPTNKCEVHVCVKTEDTLVTLKSTVPCAHFNESECLPHTIQTLANGCCKTCEEKDKACKKVSSKTQITQKGCTSTEEVDMPSCEGSCNTFSKYSPAAESMENSCSCCKELRFSNRTVDLVCANGNTIPHTYMFVEDCGCDPTECVIAEAVPIRRRRGFTLV